MNEHPAKRLEMTLEDRLCQETGWIYLTGMQALVRLPIQQRKRDIAAGLNTAGYISGYRGSPVGAYDLNLWRAVDVLKAHRIHFQPGINEDLAATATWGAQMVGLFPGATADGVFSIWYGKAPGMDRSMDALRHANLAGTSALGGTLLLVGDDHGAKSSTLACYSDLNFPTLGVPLLAPANVQDVLDMGLHGIAMSRHSGTLVGMKLVTDVVEGGGSVYVAPDSPVIVPPRNDGPDTSIKPATPFLEQEQRLWDIKIEKALTYARANRLNRIDGPEQARIGIVAAGKAWQDLNQALTGIARSGAAGQSGQHPFRLLKVGMVWPLDPEIIRGFAAGLHTILVVEEKRPLLEDQIRSILYNADHAPHIVGKFFHRHVTAPDAGDRAFPTHGEIDPGLIARVIQRVAQDADPEIGLTVPASQDPRVDPGAGVARLPSFCAGCPHGRSTQVIAGSRALAGIGCHTMAMFRDPVKTNSVSHMGGEGAAWLGQFPFTDEPHIFANMGDGTYIHSGLLAIRAAVAAGAPMTYKLLHNGFVALTGGQPHDGSFGPLDMIAQLRAEGVGRIALVADEPEKYDGKDLGNGVTLHPRTEMEHVQRELRKYPGVSVILYDQPCATERRRRRKRGQWEDPDQRVFIHPEVCEGCGDCSTISDCMAIEPLETEFGRKRKINQSACNKDFSCVEGFCPSFVTVSGARPRTQHRSDVALDVSHLPDPEIRPVVGSWAILVAGIGGAGVVTVGQTLAVAAHADGYFSSNLDITGLSQKYGAVFSHIKIAASPEQMRATRIAAGEAEALIGCDLVVATGNEALSKLTPDRSAAVCDTTIVPTSEFSRNPDWQLSAAEQIARLTGILGERAQVLQAQDMAEKLLGDRVFANMLLVGASWQQGSIPLSLAAIHRAIDLNGVSVGKNRQAFDLGRLALADPKAVGAMMGGDPATPAPALHEPALDDLLRHRATELSGYGGEAYRDRYLGAQARLKQAGLSEAALKAAARGHYKLLASKDEWEVARLYTRPSFRVALEDTFEGDLDLTFHFGAWPFGGKDDRTGQYVKGAVKGKTAMRTFAVMNRLRFLRGTFLDPFRNTEEARLARDLLAAYEADMEFAISNWSPATATMITELLDLPELIRGFGPVRERHAAAVAQTRASLRASISAQAVPAE